MTQVPNSSRYKDPDFVPNVRFGDNNNGRPAFGSPLKQNERDIKRFDGKMHGRITNAMTCQDWESITTDLVAASGKPFNEIEGLRDNVKKRFLEECPDPELRKRLNQALHQKNNNAVRHQAQQEQASKRQAQDAKRSANRAARLAKQTPKGPRLSDDSKVSKGKKGDDKRKH